VSTSTTVTVAFGDVVPNRRRGGDLRVMLSPRSVGATSGFMGAGALAPGEFIAEHYHPYSEEFLYVVRGSIAVALDGNPVELGPNESIMVPRNVRHRITNAGDEEAFVVFHCSPLAPSPELGHVDCEALPGPGDLPRVGGPGA